MVNTTERLALPLLAAGQSQKHVTHNEALVALDVLVQLAVLAQQSSPPVAPAEGDRYIVLPPGAGPWEDAGNSVVAFQDGGWQYFVPEAGWVAWVGALQAALVYDGTGWTDLKVRMADTFGVSATPDAVNRLAVASEGVLFTHAGDDSRLTINKAGSSNTASLVLQDNYSGRAELGLSGDDDFHLKVSGDGSVWHEALLVDRSSGALKFPTGVVHAASDHALAQLLPSPGVPEIWRIDAARAATPRSYTVAAIAGTTLTLTESRVPEIFTDSMRNVAMVRLWNVSKSPAQSAWVTWNSAANQVSVANEADIASWASGESLQLGDPNPTGSNVLGMIAIDISNFLQNVFGAVFPQKGVLLATYAAGIGGDVSIDGSGSGAAGSATGTASSTDGKRAYGAQTLFTAEPSPVSNSNLVFLRESLGSGTALGTCYMRLQGVYV